MHLLRQINNGSVCSLLFLSIARLFPAHGKVLEHEMQLSPQRGRDWGISGIRKWGGHWHTNGVSMAYLWRTFVTPLS